MKKLFKLLLLILLSFTLVSCIDSKPVERPSDGNPPEEIPVTPPVDEKPEVPSLDPNLGYEDEIDINLYNILEHGIYITRNEVALYIFYFNKLPSNFITKSEAGGNNGNNIKNLWTKENMLSIGGDTFGNREKLLPNRPNGSYKELDIGYDGIARGAKRIVYASPLEIYYTSDHYDSFIWLNTEEMRWTSYSMG